MTIGRFSRFMGISVNRLLHPFGLNLSRLPTHAPAPLFNDSWLSRLSARSIPVNTVIDIGASTGIWSESMRRIYPDAEYLLVEANDVHKTSLESYVSRHEKSRFTLAAASDQVGTIFFDGRDPFGGAASHEATSNATMSVACTSVDAEVKKHQLESPYFLKLDTHGFELPIFEGATDTLLSTNLICVETYNFNLNGKCLKFWEMCRYLEEKGFLPMDLFEPLFRPRDGVLWQVDILFARADREEFKYTGYE